MPKKYNTPHRSVTVKTRLTKEEYATFAEVATLCGVSKAAFIRKAITGALLKPTIAINSLRIADVPMLPYMDRPADVKAGMKHRCTKAAMDYFRAEVMEMCHREGLYQIDLLNGSEDRVNDREYWAQKKGQAKLDKSDQPNLTP